jgi:hypothetical protein
MCVYFYIYSRFDILFLYMLNLFSLYLNHTIESIFVI